MASIPELGARIAANTEVLNHHLSSKNARPSFNQEELEFPDLSDNSHAYEARQTLLDDTQTLFSLLLGPSEIIRRICNSPYDVAAQNVIYDFKIYEAVPLEGSISYADLAAKVNLPEHRVKTVIRQSILNHVFDEPLPDQVVHTAASRVLIKDKPTLDWYGHFVNEVFPASAKVSETLKRYPGSSKPEDCAFSTAFGIRDPIFKFFEDHPDRQARFFGAMSAIGKNPGYSLDYIIRGYDWESLGDATVVDLGGSSGFVSIALANAYPNLNFVVQDYQHTVDQGQEKLPSHLKDRVKFEAHDFFTPQPVKADVFLLRHICHDWSLENAAKVLANLLPAMKPSSRVIMVETVLMPPGTFHSIQERQQRNMEMTMWNMLNAQERTVEDWEKVVKQADNHLSILNIHRPKGSWDSLIEVGLLLN